MDWSAVTKQANELFMKLHELHVEFYLLWKDHVFLTWRWWIGISLIVLPWALWFIVRKKDSADRLLYAGLISMLLSSSMDVVGIAMGLWAYPANVFPLMPEFIPFDISSLPVATMLFIQFFPKIKPVYKAVVYGAVGAFVFEPLMSWLGLYSKLGWKSIYTFPILVGIYLVANHFANKKNFSKI